MELHNGVVEHPAAPWNQRHDETTITAAIAVGLVIAAFVAGSVLPAGAACNEPPWVVTGSQQTQYRQIPSGCSHIVVKAWGSGGFGFGCNTRGAGGGGAG